MNKRLPGSQAIALSKVSEVHGHNTRAAGVGLAIKTQDRKSIGYRIPKEWESLAKELKETRSLSGFKKRSKDEFLAVYKAFTCEDNSCYVCGSESSSSAEQ